VGECHLGDHLVCERLVGMGDLLVVMGDLLVEMGDLLVEMGDLLAEMGDLLVVMGNLLEKIGNLLVEMGEHMVGEYLIDAWLVSIDGLTRMGRILAGKGEWHMGECPLGDH
jgi:hypothetical protein